MWRHFVSDRIIREAAGGHTTRPPRLATLHADINILFQADVSPPCVDGVEDCSMQSGHVGMLRCQVLLLSPGNISWLALVRWRGSGDAGDCCYPPL